MAVCMNSLNPEYFEIFDYLTDILVFIKDKQGAFLNANTCFIDTFGLKDKEEVVGKTDLELFGPKLADVYTIGDRKILNGELPVFHQEELIYTLNSDHTTKFLTTKYPIKDSEGKVYAVIGISRDALNLREATRSSNQLKKALDYIDTNYMKDIKITTLSEMSNMSDSTFLRTFKRDFNLTPKRYIISRRLKKVAEFLVGSDKPFCEISILCGFSDQSHMTREFKRVTGITPSADQRKMKAEVSLEKVC